MNATTETLTPEAAFVIGLRCITDAAVENALLPLPAMAELLRAEATRLEKLPTPAPHETPA